MSIKGLLSADIVPGAHIPLSQIVTFRTEVLWTQ
jgi:hypothetical protein